MNADSLLEHFDRISEAPGAVVRLRRFILDLAVRGKLLEHSANWYEITLGEIGEWGSGGTPSKSHPEYYGGDIPWLVIGDLNEELVTRAETYITEVGLKNSSAKMVKPGTVLIAMYGSIGKLGIAGIRCATNQAIAFCVPDLAKVSREFLVVVLKSLREELLEKGHGVAQQNISQKILKAHPIKLPPLAEQNRIVAKVDELMALCDQLEAAKNEREARRDRLVAASLHRIGTAPAAADEAATEAQSATRLRDAARFHLDHLPRHTTRPEHIKQLRQTILGLVFQGYLTRRLDEDGLGIDLVNEIYRQWEADVPTIARAGKSKPTTKFECEPAFSAPETWGWIRLQLLCEQIGDIDHKMPRAVSEGVPFLSAKDLKDSGKLDFSDPKYISEEDFMRLSRKILPRRDDIIYSRIGARLGKARLVEVDTRFLISYSCCLIRPKHQFVDKRFLQIFLDSHLALKQAHSGVQSIGVPDLGLGEIKAYRIPIPPLAEQHRIVAKVDELMALCDQLEARLTATQIDSRRLLEAVLQEALSPSLRKAA